MNQSIPLSPVPRSLYSGPTAQGYLTQLKMPLFAIPLISLFFFSGFAVAGIYAPNCSLTWAWSFNSLGQNACTVAAYMFSTCHGGSFTLQPLSGGYYYSGPSAAEGTDLCLCNLIAYSLLCACDGCQGSTWSSWSDYVSNCTTILPPGSFPNPIPAGTSLQRWTLLDITTENNWNANNSQAVGDNPELGPGTILGPDGPSFSSSIGPSTIVTPVKSAGSPPQTTNSIAINTSSLSPTVGSSSNTTTSNPGHVGHRSRGHSSNTGAIAGGTVAGVAAISIVALLFYRKRRLSLSGAYNPNVIQDPPQPTSGQETATSSFPRTSVSLRPYNPEDPTTFPGHQPPPNPPFTSAPLPSSSNIRHIYTVATPPGPETRRFEG